MKIVDKIRILIVPLVLVPFVAIVIGTIFFGRVYLYNIYGQYNSDGIHPYANPIYAMNGSAEAVLRELQTEVQQNPDQFLDVTYLKQIETELREKHVDFLMLVDRSVYYCSASFPEQYLALIPDYDAAAESIEGGIYVDDKTPFYIRQEDFMLSDGRDSSFFVVIYAETVSTYMRRALIEIAIFVALVLGLVSAFITIYMYRNFLRPLKALQEGTNRIKEGNLNEDVEIMANDEIGQVCQSFNEMREKLRESVDDRMRQEEENRELINNISHDLRTPITAIKGYVEGLMDGVADTPEKMDKYIKTIYNKTNEMDVLINELSLYSKIDTNSIPYDFIKLKVSAYFNDCFTELAMDMEHSHVKVNYRNTCPDDTRVIADPEQLRRVINNIIVNAVKYNKKDERIIDITVKPYGFDQIYVGIKDNGDGISEEDLPRIFDRMYRTDASRNAQTGGSGLGLAIAKKIIEEHEGSIWAESKNGEGTLIAFTLNLAREGGNEYEQSSDH